MAAGLRSTLSTMGRTAASSLCTFELARLLELAHHVLDRRRDRDVDARSLLDLVLQLAHRLGGRARRAARRERLRAVLVAFRVDHDLAAVAAAPRRPPRRSGHRSPGTGTAFRARDGPARTRTSRLRARRRGFSGIWARRCVPGPETGPVTVTNRAGRERDAGRKNMTNGRFLGRKTPDSGHKKGRPPRGPALSSAPYQRRGADHDPAVVLASFLRSSCRRPARTRPCPPS